MSTIGNIAIDGGASTIKRREIILLAADGFIFKNRKSQPPWAFAAFKQMRKNKIVLTRVTNYDASL